jgi:hypothetical protein
MVAALLFHLERIGVNQGYQRRWGDQDITLVQVTHYIAGSMERSKGRSQVAGRPVQVAPVKAG